MQNFLAALMALALVGCTVAGLQESAPAYSGTSHKSPQSVARCLAPKWQELNSSTSSIQTETGYKIAASSDMTGVVALAVIDDQPGGTSVRVFLPTDWALTSGWKESAKDCI